MLVTARILRRMFDLLGRVRHLRRHVIFTDGGRRHETSRPAGWRGSGGCLDARLRMLAMLPVVMLTACGRPDDASLGARGAIDDRAPVRTDQRIVVAASPAQVWKVLTDVRHWPAWQHDVGSVSIADVPATGVSFRWTISGGTIHSRIVLFEPGRRLAWVGRFLVFHAVHVWTLVAANGGTEVRTTESIGGWPIGLFTSSEELGEADRRWLAALRHAVQAGS